MRSDVPHPSSLRGAWWGALACFILAGATGFLFRLGLSTGTTAGLDLTNVRHAHSHLMYFGWATPALMALISRRLPAQTGRPFPPAVRWVLGAVFGAALLAYPLFAAFGYTPVVLGEKRLPLAVIAASLNMMVWYVFVGLYVRSVRGAERTRALVFWDAALIFLVLATGGAWGVAVLKPLGVESVAWSTALTHIFLDYFAEGWFVLAVLGLAYAEVDSGDRPAGHWSLWLLILGLPVTFALGMPTSLVPPGLKTMASVGAGLVAVGLLANVWMLGRALPKRSRWLWGIPLVLLAAKAVAQGVVGLWPGVWWAGLHGLRILYLHLMLLGFVTLGLVAAASSVWGATATRGRTAMYAAVVLLLASLLPLTTLWPAPWRGAWALEMATWIALAPTVAAAWMLGRGVRRRKENPRNEEEHMDDSKLGFKALK